MKIATEFFGETDKNEQIDLICFQNDNGSYMKVTNYGARLVALGVPDKKGRIDDVVQGYTSYNDYKVGARFYGANPGPFANRIKDAKFSINGTTYTFTANDGVNLLHSGKDGFDSIVWEYCIEKDSVVFSHHSPDGEFGFPGNRLTTITYRWNEDLKLSIEYKSKTDKPTHLNITHHSYFNLNGDSCDTINDHKVSIFANYYLETGNGLIPTGKYLPVENTPLDLREGQLISKNVDSDFPAISKCLGFDHCYVIDRQNEGLAHHANVIEPYSGRTMDVYSTLPGIQFYTDNHDNGNQLGKSGKIYPKRSAFCLEPQFFPDSPNHNSFPSTLITPEKEYYHTIIYQFNKKH